jgi:hypothetical protein
MQAYFCTQILPFRKLLRQSPRKCLVAGNL